MDSHTRKMPLKQYLEAVKEHCRGLSKEELVETLLELAKEAPARERVDFLGRIQASAPGSTAPKKKPGEDFEKALLERIVALGDEIRERIESIENGDYWEEPDYREYGGYDDEGPDYVSSEQIEELEDLFMETGGIFLDGRLKTAGPLYRALFDLLDSNEEIDGHISPQSLDIREERARYCRCVYETVDPERRVESVLACVDIDASLDSHRLDLPSEKSPMLQDVIDARPGELADLETFLPPWEKRLARYHGDRAAVLRMEAVLMLDGINGVSKLARKWKSDRPYGYLFWIQCLANEGKWRETIDACIEALAELPRGYLREQAADCLTTAATQLETAEHVLLGKREKFLSVSGERNLLELLGEARKQNVRLRELDTVLASLKQDKETDRYGRGTLYVKALLIAGRVREAFFEARGEKGLGWSSGKAGALFASLLSLLVDNSAKAVTVGNLLKQYAAGHDYYDDGEDDTEAGGIHEEILTGLKSAEVGESEAREYRAWVDKIGRERIEAIVSGQHRGAYDRAAGVLGALAEHRFISNGAEEARSLLREYVSVKFPRHTAFRKEVKKVVSGSSLLRDLRVV